MNNEYVQSGNFNLDQEEQELTRDIQKARALKILKVSEGWEIVSDTLDALRSQAVVELGEVQPGDNERVLAAHAIFYAVTGTINNLRQAVDSAIVRGEHEAPVRLKEIEEMKKITLQQF